MVRPDRAELTAPFPFAPDRFQVEAFDAVDAGRHVVVAAPTSSGKTVVAEYGIAAALADGRRSFYTAPIKALSNQKFRDLRAVHGDDRVGLLTGDHSINPEAPIVVMTTEVLRNMIYSGRPLADLGVVVLDEVHYLQDAYRGQVWEEVIVHLPRHVRLICLSATVSNVAELGEWIATVRGETSTVVEERRPVPLENHYLVADRTDDRLVFLPTLVDGHPNRRAMRLDESRERRGRRWGSGGRDGGGRPGGDDRRRRSERDHSGTRRLATPGRVETIRLLEERGLLPTIFFIFSRAQCEEAAATCLDAGIRLTHASDHAAIDRIAAERLEDLRSDDLEVLGYDRFIDQLHAGIAAHHAGMVPAMKEVVEQCFVEGHIGLVFATETLSLGINMPARSVVIEKLTKFTGDHHEKLTAGQYTQLTGRAGRRGIDEVGDAVVLWSPWVRFDEVAEIAASTTYVLRSAFRPTYNMAANLVRTHDPDGAHHLLGLSFAQFQADRDVVRIESRIERKRERMAELAEAATSPYGDLEAYRSRRREEHRRREERRSATAGEMRGALARLRPGQIIRFERGDQRGPVVVVATAHRSSGVRLTLVNRSGDLLHADGGDFDDLPRAVGEIAMPKRFAPRQRQFRDEVAKRLRATRVGSDGRRGRGAKGVRDDGAESAGVDPVDAVTEDPDFAERMRAADRADKVGREIARLEERIAERHRSLADEFDRVLGLLERLGYVDVAAWQLTPAGRVLCRVFHESDLLVAEILHQDLLDGLDAPDVAALVSCVVYEHRSPDDPPAPWFSSRRIADRWRRIEALSEDLRARERSAGLAEHRAPDPTFAAIAHAWVAGEGFAEIVEEEDLTGGDFVRTMRQLVDLLRQIAQIAPDPATAEAAGRAADGAFRGVVADSSVTG